MAFKLSLSFLNPSRGSNPQRGFPEIGAAGQTTGRPSYNATQNKHHVGDSVRPTKGYPSWLCPDAPSSEQRGFAVPESRGQERPPGSMPNIPPVYGEAIPVYTPYYSRGAAAFVQNFGKVLTNPIGAGIVALYRPQASYGVSGQYYDSQIFWASQVIPTSINMSGLTDPETLLAILGTQNIYAAVRTTG